MARSSLSVALCHHQVITPLGVIATGAAVTRGSEGGPEAGSEQSEGPGAGDGIGPRGRTEFAIDALEVGFERVHGNIELACDLPGREAGLQAVQNFLLPLAQSGASRSGAGSVACLDALGRGEQRVGVVVAGRAHQQGDQIAEEAAGPVEDCSEEPVDTCDLDDVL